MPKTEPLKSKAATLIEALPYLQRFRGRAFLVKIGGSAMDDRDLLSAFMRDIVFLELVGINPILVHGGGKAISAAMSEAGLEAEFVGGLRITTPETIRIVETTLGGAINPNLVQLINRHGGRAVGIPGQSVFQARRITGTGPDGQPVDIGHVGKVAACRTDEIQRAMDTESVPVISPLGHEIDTGNTLNVNADLAAAALACTLHPAKLVFVSDVPGLLGHPGDPGSLLPTVTPDTARQLITSGAISGGMIPKIRSALEALEAGVEKVHFIDGRIPHTLLLEIFTQEGIGTEITAPDP